MLWQDQERIQFWDHLCDLWPGVWGVTRGPRPYFSLRCNHIVFSSLRFFRFSFQRRWYFLCIILIGNLFHRVQNHVFFRQKYCLQHWNDWILGNLYFHRILICDYTFIHLSNNGLFHQHVYILYSLIFLKNIGKAKSSLTKYGLSLKQRLALALPRFTSEGREPPRASWVLICFPTVILGRARRHNGHAFAYLWAKPVSNNLRCRELPQRL